MSIFASTVQQTEFIHAETAFKKQVKAIIENGDTIALYELPTVWVYPPMKFKNKREEKFYWRTVRDVKKTLPLSKYIKEVIIAISTSVEGETTLFYLLNRLKAFPEVKVSTIARGIGFGDELEYVDELTITHALINRRELKP